VQESNDFCDEKPNEINASICSPVRKCSDRYNEYSERFIPALAANESCIGLNQFVTYDPQRQPRMTIVIKSLMSALAIVMAMSLTGISASACSALPPAQLIFDPSGTMPVAGKSEVSAKVRVLSAPAFALTHPISFVVWAAHDPVALLFPKVFPAEILEGAMSGRFVTLAMNPVTGRWFRSSWSPDLGGGICPDTRVVPKLYAEGFIVGSVETATTGGLRIFLRLWNQPQRF
jgi:hypothetical protein